MPPLLSLVVCSCAAARIASVGHVLVRGCDAWADARVNAWIPTWNLTKEGWVVSLPQVGAGADGVTLRGLALADTEYGAGVPAVGFQVGMCACTHPCAPAMPCVCMCRPFVGFQAHLGSLLGQDRHVRVGTAAGV